MRKRDHWLRSKGRNRHKKTDDTKKFHKEIKVHSIIEFFMMGLNSRNYTLQKSKVLSMYSL